VQRDSSDLEVVQAALGTGALGYVYKMNAQKELLSAVDAVLLGKQFVGSGLTGRN
jgi:DNA-binding NarL/FixJ family response regulator